MPNVSGHCQKNPASYELWNKKFKNTKPENWPYKEKTKSWSTEETERVLEAICELPKQLWTDSKYEIYRMQKSKDGENPATSANGVVVLYDSAFGKKSLVSRILAHEFAHELYANMSASKSLDYRMKTNWFTYKNKFGKNVYISRKEGYVADDGRVSPEEDFANNIEYFLFDNKNLLKTTPHAFNWIQDNFGDKFKKGGCK